MPKRFVVSHGIKSSFALFLSRGRKKGRKESSDVGSTSIRWNALTPKRFDSRRRKNERYEIRRREREKDIRGREEEESGREARGNGGSVRSRLKMANGRERRRIRARRRERICGSTWRFEAHCAQTSGTKIWRGPPCLRTDHIPSPPDFLVREPYPPARFAVLHSICVRVYIDSPGSH